MFSSLRYRTMPGMRGLDLTARTLSVPTPMGTSRSTWQYHPRSDRHSKIACWSILFDLLCSCGLLASQAAAGRVCFGINHEMTDFRMNRRKCLDLVVCTPGSGAASIPSGFRRLASDYALQLDDGDREVLENLPLMAQAPVGSVLIALEAKACMTEHSKARPRLYDELNSSQQTVHGASDICIAAGFVMVNASREFRSPTKPGSITTHSPTAASKVIEKLKELPRRTTTGAEGFDALAIAVVECENDPARPVHVVTEAPAPSASEVFHYDQMIRRVVQLYEARFPRA